MFPQGVQALFLRLDGPRNKSRPLHKSSDRLCASAASLSAALMGVGWGLRGGAFSRVSGRSAKPVSSRPERSGSIEIVGYGGKIEMEAAGYQAAVSHPVELVTAFEG